MTLIHLVAFAAIALFIQNLLSGFGFAGYSWYRRLRRKSNRLGVAIEYAAVLSILWVALVLSTEITYIIGLKLYE